MVHSISRRQLLVGSMVGAASLATGSYGFAQGTKSLTQKPRRAKRLMANWIAARVTKAARVSARFS
jgi:hypothetical protein